MQKDFTEQVCCLGSRLAHAEGVKREDFRFQEAEEEWKEDFVEDGHPFRVVLFLAFGFNFEFGGVGSGG